MLCGYTQEIQERVANDSGFLLGGSKDGDYALSPLRYDGIIKRRDRNMRNLLVTGNSTMPSSVGIFNLPPLKTCTPSDWCREHCYGLQGRFIWFTIKETLEWRYKQSLRDDFVEKMIDEIKRRKKIKYVRPHITGDFYSLNYLCKWLEIIKQCSDILFRVTTRRQDLLPFIKKHQPENFIVRESTDNTRESLGLFPQAAIQGVEGTEKFFVCIDDCEECKFHCYNNPAIDVVTGKIR